MKKTEKGAIVEIRRKSDPQNKVVRTLTARAFQVGGGTDMIRLEDRAQGVMMEIKQLRDLLDQLGYSLILTEDAKEIVEGFNEGIAPMRCLKCGRTMKKAEGYRCSGYVCLECGHEDADNSYY